MSSSKRCIRARGWCTFVMLVPRIKVDTNFGGDRDFCQGGAAAAGTLGWGRVSREQSAFPSHGAVLHLDRISASIESTFKVGVPGWSLSICSPLV